MCIETDQIIHHIEAAQARFLGKIGTRFINPPLRFIEDCPLGPWTKHLAKVEAYEEAIAFVTHEGDQDSMQRLQIMQHDELQRAAYACP